MTTTKPEPRTPSTSPAEWFRIDVGSGRPLVLLHGGGSSSTSWLAILGQLARDRRVIAFDLPGFGNTPAPAEMQYTLAWITAQLAAQLKLIGIDTPVDMAGNSMGGWLALEAAKAGLARSVIAIGPAGLWHGGMPVLLQTQFKALLIGTRATRGRGHILFRSAKLRRAALSLIVAKPDHVPAEAMADIANTFDRSRPVLKPLLRVARNDAFRGGSNLTIPVTIAFGTEERMVLAHDGRFRDQLPAHTRWIDLPGCGHVPMTDNPHLIAQTILDATPDAVRPVVTPAL